MCLNALKVKAIRGKRQKMRVFARFAGSDRAERERENSNPKRFQPSSDWI
jgi:hypothetical protein